MYFQVLQGVGEYGVVWEKGCGVEIVQQVGVIFVLEDVMCIEVVMVDVVFMQMGY